MKDVPTQGPAFETMMREIDAKLKADGKDIADRPIFAVGEVSIRYDIPIPMGGEPKRLPPNLGRMRHSGKQSTGGTRSRTAIG